jgi:hypothetical protein
VTHGGKRIPNRPFELDFANNKYMKAYHALLRSLNIATKNIGLAFDYEDYSKGFFVQGFDLTRDHSAFESHDNVPQDGSIRLEGTFKQPLTTNVTAIVLATTKQTMQITEHRDVIVDYTH